MILEQYEDVLTVEDLCGVLNIGANTAYRMLKEHAIPAFRIGRRWKIPKEAVISYLANWKS